MNDPKVKDGFMELLQTQVQHDLPDFLEANIMAKIESMPKRKVIPVSLQSVFILSSLASFYILLSVLAFYYYPDLSLLQDVKTMVSLIFLVKLAYDLNELLPDLFQQFSFFKKLNHR